MRSHSVRLCAALLAMLGAAWAIESAAQSSPKPVRIGWLANTPLLHVQRAAFEGGLGAAGLTPSIEMRNAEGDTARLPAFAAELVRLRVELIVASSAVAARAAKQATTQVPIVMVAADPVGQGIVSGLARPGGNITGVSLIFDAPFAGKWVELLKETVPRLQRITTFTVPAPAASVERLKGMQNAGTTHGIRIEAVVVHGADDVDRALSALTRQLPDAMIVDGAPALVPYVARVREFSARHRVPTIYAHAERVEEGGLMSYGPDIADAYRKAAVYAAKILRGAKPADLPVEQSDKFEFVINVKTAKAMGLTMPRSVLLRADRVIE